MVGHRPADDAAAEAVQHDREVVPALAGAVLGDVGDVEPVRRRGPEVALDQVLGRGRGLVAAGAAAQPPAVHALQAGAAHQALHPAVADLQPLAKDELGVHPAVAVGAVGGGVGLADRVHQVRLLQARALAGRLSQS